MTQRANYVTVFEGPGAMCAGFGLYRAVDQDAVDNRKTCQRDGKLRMPVLGLGGDASFFAPVAAEMLSEVAQHVSVATISRCGHWIAEENLGDLLRNLLEFMGPAA